MPLSMMPSFTPLNTSDSHLVEELDMRDVDDEIIEDAFKDALSFTDPLGSLPEG